MPRRTPSGETDIEVLADYARRLERRLTDLEGMVAGRLPHDHDARYVEAAGDTMTGDLLVETGDVRLRRDVSGTTRDLRLWQGDGASPIEHRRGGTVVSSLWWRDGSIEAREDFHVIGTLDVAGAKNAKIPHPDDPTRAFHFAAVEADEPGLLAHRWLNVHVDREATLSVPEHWGRIARDPMVMVSHASEPDDASPRAPFGWADLGAGQVTVRAPKGDYHVVLVACRSDLDGRWSHEVAVDPDEDDDV